MKSKTKSSVFMRIGLTLIIMDNFDPRIRTITQFQSNTR